MSDENSRGATFAVVGRYETLKKREWVTINFCFSILETIPFKERVINYTTINERIQ